LEVRKLGVTRVGASRTAEMLNEGRKRLNLDLIETKTKSAAGY
jgi:deoxyribose-phosphate aldolase